MDDISSVILRAKRLAMRIRSKRIELLSVLTQIESYFYASDEMDRSIDCLENIYSEHEYLTRKVHVCSSFMPINQPLYGLILFGIVPSYKSENIYIRPSADTVEYVEKIASILSICEDHKNVHIKNITRKKFISRYVSISDVVIFVGKYDNAENMISYLKPNGLLIYSGSGMNPFLITANANIELAAEKSVNARLYNSGQDCAAPNVFLVHKNIYDDFFRLLKNKLSVVISGYYSDPVTINGPLIRDSSVMEAMNLLLKNRSKIVYGGNVDIKAKIIYPTIVKADITDCIVFFEFFSPVFTIVCYENEIDLKQFFWDERYYKYSMYVSLFGDLMHEDYLNNSIILRNKNILDEEQGNKPFGGYGSQANFVYSNNRKESYPILITKEMDKYGLING